MKSYHSHTETDGGSAGHHLVKHEVTHDEIEALAYDLYLSSGRVQGQCRENWEMAERSLQERGHCQTQVRGAENAVPQR